jgi:hypothetical protein
MTSAITPNTINANFPVAGQDNDSQGFRDNYAEIVSNFTTAASEISALQTNSINVTASSNNLQGTTIYNAIYNQLSSSLRSVTATGAESIDLSLATTYNYTVTGACTFTFTNWPTFTVPTNTPVYSSATIIVKGNGTSHSLTFSANSGGTVTAAHGDSMLSNNSGSAVMTLPASTSMYVLEAFTLDGLHAFIKTKNYY